MTQIDGLSLPVRLPIDGEAFDAACEYARIHDLTISAAASEMLRSFAPSVEQGLRPPAPEDGREGSGEPPASLPSLVSSNVGQMPPLTLEESKALHPSSRPVKVDTFLRPMPHIHPGAPPCVFGDRCGR